MPTDMEVNAILGFKKGDTSGLTLASSTSAALADARAEVERIAKKGGMAALALGSEKVSRAGA